MKALPLFAFLSAFAAFALLPIPFEWGASLLFAAGFGAIALRDYSNLSRPVRVGQRAMAGSGTRAERLGLAA